MVILTVGNFIMIYRQTGNRYIPSLCGLRLKKHIIFHILYIIVAPLCSAFLKRVDFYKAHRSEKRGVLWLASYPVRCDWPNTSGVRRKCYALLPYCDAVYVTTQKQ